MAALKNDERLQPSLLDRLLDDEVDKKDESRVRRVLSLNEYKRRVYRDMAWLLNTSALAAVQDLSAYPEVESSVLNYGVQGFSGTLASSIDVRALEKRLHQTILDFEPRILAKTLKIRVSLADDQMGHNTLTFDIAGKLWAQPIPVEMYLKTELDFEAGSVKVVDDSGQVFG
jgi:type VI secretion system protein ImpF